MDTLKQNRSPWIRRIRIRDRIDWQDASRLLASEWRFQTLRSPLLALLCDHDLRFLPDAASPDFLERSKPSTTRAGADTLKIYWGELGRLRPSTAQEEFVLARAIDLLRATIWQLLCPHPDATSLAFVQEHLSPYSALLERVQKQNWDGPEQALSAGRRARLQQRLLELQKLQEALVDRNLHRVPHTARKYSNLGVPIEDLIQEGNTALLRAVERYDRNLGLRFGNYAHCWIQQGILKALSFQSRSVRLPVYLAQTLHRVHEAQSQDPEPLDVESLARQTRVSPERVDRALRADRRCFSIDQQVGGEAEDGLRLADTLADPRPTEFSEQFDPNEMAEVLQAGIRQLPDREALVLRLRYGLETGVPQTLVEIGQRLGVSRERVRQLHAQAIGRLARPGNRRNLERFLDG